MVRRSAGVMVVLMLATACSSGPKEPVGQEIEARTTSSVGSTSSPSTSKPSTTAAPATPSSPASSTSTKSSGYIARMEWVSGARGKSLHITPTEQGRTATSPDAEVKAWVEVLQREPKAAGISMQRQFSCHWRFARDKPTWNLETWRPVVSMKAVIDAQCNPGGPE